MPKIITPLSKIYSIDELPESTNPESTDYVVHQKGATTYKVQSRNGGNKTTSELVALDLTVVKEGTQFIDKSVGSIVTVEGSGGSAKYRYHDLSFATVAEMNTWFSAIGASKIASLQKATVAGVPYVFTGTSMAVELPPAIQSYGGKGTGTTTDGVAFTHPDDDTEALEDLINANAGISNLRPGSYKVTRPLRITATKMHIVGAMAAATPDIVNSIFLGDALTTQIFYEPVTATAWASSTVYAFGDRVNTGGETYWCTTAHTSTGSFSDDKANWTVDGDAMLVVFSNADFGSGKAVANNSTNLLTLDGSTKRSRGPIVFENIRFHCKESNGIKIGYTDADSETVNQDTVKTVRVRNCAFVGTQNHKAAANGNAATDVITRDGYALLHIVGAYGVEVTGCGFTNGDYQLVLQNCDRPIITGNRLVEGNIPFRVIHNGNATDAANNAIDNFLSNNQVEGAGICALVQSGIVEASFVDLRLENGYPDQHPGYQPLEATVTATKALNFTSGGTYEIVAGNTITGATSGRTATVASVTLTSGSWAGGDAAGVLAIHSESGSFQSENLDVGANSNVATTSGDAKTRQSDFTWTFSESMTGKIWADECCLELVRQSNPDDRYYLVPSAVNGTDVTFYGEMWHTSWTGPCYVNRLMGGSIIASRGQDRRIQNITSSIKHTQINARVLSFDTGSVEIMEEMIVEGGTSGATARVGLVVVESGSWSGSDAAGKLYLFNVTGTFSDGEDLEVATAKYAEAIASSAWDSTRSLRTLAASTDNLQPPTAIVTPRSYENTYIDGIDCFYRSKQKRNVIANCMGLASAASQIGVGSVYLGTGSERNGFDVSHPILRCGSQVSWDPTGEPDWRPSEFEAVYPVHSGDTSDRMLKRWVLTPRTANTTLLGWRRSKDRGIFKYGWDVGILGSPAQFRIASLPHADDGFYKIRVRAIGTGSANVLGLSFYGSGATSKTFGTNISTSAVSEYEAWFRPSDVTWSGAQANYVGINTACRDVCILSIEISQENTGTLLSRWGDGVEWRTATIDATQVVGTTGSIELPDFIGTDFSVVVWDWFAVSVERDGVSTNAIVEVGDSVATNRWGSVTLPTTAGQFSNTRIGNKTNTAFSTTSNLEWRIATQGVASGNYTFRLVGRASLTK